MTLKLAEQDRLAALRDLDILDTPPEAEFDALVRAASLLCDVPMSLVSLVDEDRQWFKANVGLEGVTETPRAISFCTHTILGEQILEVPDAQLDARFADNPLVTGAPHIRFYAGVPLRLSGGQVVGSLCVIDRKPHVLSDTQREILRCLAKAASSALESASVRRRYAAAAAALRNAYDRLSLATESCGIGIWDWDIATGSMLWDVTMYRLYGVDEEDAASPIELWARHLHPDDRAADDQAVRAAVASLGNYENDFRIVRPDGSVRHIHGAGRITQIAEGRALRMIGANQDVTEQRTARDMRAARDAADRASRAKSDFLATMSHEIRTPLSGLVGVLELLVSTALDEEQRRMAKMIDNSANHLLEVLNDILDFSKIEAGAMSVSLEPASLHSLVDGVAQLMAVKARHRGLGFACTIDPSVPPFVLTDKLRLRQILTNLLANAIKFTARGEVALDLRVAREAAGPMLCFAVRDTGIGIPEEAIRRLFDPFVQADQSTTREFGGTGLGLSISYKLARLLDGDISVTSTPGAGSVFRLMLKLQPCVTVHDPSARGQPPDEPARSTIATAGRDTAPAIPQQGRGTALVVDDDATVRFLTQRQLAKLGFKVDSAADGDAALTRLLAARYDLLVTDCHMPRMDGVELTRRLRASPDAHLRSMPVIGLTADVTETQRALCLAAGFTTLAVKPLLLTDLAALLAKSVANETVAG